MTLRATLADYVWTQSFKSLDFAKEGIIDASKINVTEDPERISIVAVSPDGDEQPLPFSVTEEAIRFTVGHLNSPVSSIDVRDLYGRTMLHADGLYAADDAAYSEMFRSNKSRPPSESLCYFIGDQIVKYFTGSSAYRISGGVFAVYKAIELHDPQRIEEAGGSIALMKSLVSDTSVKRSPRLNREHLQLSIWCAEWQLNLAAGNYRRTVECLEEMRQHLVDTELHSYFTPAFPANKSLLMLCLAHCLAGNTSEASQVANLAVSLFKRSVRDLDSNIVHFKELQGVHASALACMRLTNREREPSAKEIHRNLREACRIDEARHPQAFDKMIETLREGARRSK